MKKTILATAIGLMLSSTLVLAAETSQPSGVVMLPESNTQPQAVNKQQETAQKQVAEAPKFDLIKRKSEIKSLIEQNKITSKPELFYYLDKQDNGVIFDIDRKIAEQKLQYLKETQDLTVDRDKKIAELKQKQNEINAQMKQLEEDSNLKYNVLKTQNAINEDFMSKVRDATLKDLQNERSFILNYSENTLKIK